MAERIAQSVAKLMVFRAYLASDGKTPATGKTIAITISKNGATSFSNPNAGATNATEMASGFYKFTLDTTDTGTIGPVAWRGAHADINDAGDVLSVQEAVVVPSDLAEPEDIADEVRTELTAELGRIDVATSTRSTDSGVWVVATRTLTAFDSSFKTGYALSAAGVQAMWDALTSALTIVGSIGKVLVDNVNATISSRSSHSAADVAALTPTALQNADALLDRADAIETGVTLRQAQRLAVAALAGKLAGAATATVTIRNAVADSKTRITATVDADGNRTAVVHDVT